MTHVPSLPAASRFHISVRRTLKPILAFLSTLGTVAIDCRNAMVGVGVTMGKAFEMLYVEPYQPRHRDDPWNPDNF